MHEVRFYRHYFSSTDLSSFEVSYLETDLWIGVDQGSNKQHLEQKAKESIKEARRLVENYIAKDPEFKTTLLPYQMKEKEAPALVTAMVKAGNAAGVGPMAAVAGVFAETVGKCLVECGAKEVIVENGGDIFIRTQKTRRIGVYAGESPLSGRVGLEISPADTPLGVCTSSGTVGHSFSQGKADAVIVVAPSVPLADAAATALANLVQVKSDLEKVVQKGRQLKGLTGVLAICEDQMAVWGNIRLCQLPFT